jgi:hypothetical protein
MYLEYTEFVALLTQVWLALFVVAILLWLGMRLFVLAPMRRSWNEAYDTNTKQWAKDYWDDGSKPLVEKKKTLMLMQQRNFEEVAKPLERYVWVFVLFLPPAIVLATKYCAEHSTFSATCDAPSEMVLAFRSVGTCTVYFIDDECRAQLRDWRKLCRKLLGRLSRICCCGRDGHDLTEVRWSSDPEQINIIERRNTSLNDNDRDDDERESERPQRILYTYATKQDYQLMCDDVGDDDNGDDDNN